MKIINVFVILHQEKTFLATGKQICLFALVFLDFL